MAGRWHLIKLDNQDVFTLPCDWLTAITWPPHTPLLSLSCPHILRSLSDGLSASFGPRSVQIQEDIPRSVIHSGVNTST